MNYNDTDSLEVFWKSKDETNGLQNKKKNKAHE